MYKTGDIIFVKNKGWLFNNIRDLTDSDFDHVGILSVGDTIMVIDATPLAGVAMRPIECFRNNEYKVYRLKAPYQSFADKMIDYCENNMGRSYDFIQALCLYVMIAFKMKTTLDPVDIRNAFVCSELISQAAEYAGFYFVDNKIATDRITPADILYSNKLYEVD